MNTNTVKQTKTFAVVTYCIALVCMLLGLLLPFYDGGLLALKLPEIFNALTSADLAAQILNFAVLGYVAFTALGLVALIPVFVSKKESKTAKTLAGLVEIFGFAMIFAVVATLLWNGTGLMTIATDYLALLIALGGVAIIGLIQIIKNKKGSGVIKLIMFTLSLLAVIMILGLAFFNVEALTGLEGELANLIGNNKFFDGLVGKEYIVNVYENITDISALLGTEIFVQITNACVLVVVVGTIVNLVLDYIALATGTNKFCKIVNIIRYALVVVAAVAAILLAEFVIKVSVGMYITILAAIVLIQLIIAIFRTMASPKENYAVENNEAEVEEAYQPDTSFAEPAYAPAQPYAQPVYVQPVIVQPAYQHPYGQPAYQQPAQPVQPAQPAQPEQPYQQPAQPEQQVVYTVTPIYNGPTDSFIETLSGQEKIEFAQMFIEKKNGSFANVPDYVVGGNNEQFFSAIFLYLGKFRSMLSDGLMYKIYSQLKD